MTISAQARKELGLDQQVTDPHDAVRHFWTVERFFHIKTVAATVKLMLLFVILIALTVRSRTTVHEPFNSTACICTRRVSGR